MEAKAIHRGVPTSPRKMRLVVDLIRGKGVEEALSILHFHPQHASKVVEKIVHSAVSNYVNKVEQDEDGRRVNPSTLYIKTAFVDAGAMFKRVLPAPMGRAYRVRKRSNHVTVIVTERAVKTKS